MNGVSMRLCVHESSSSANRTFLQIHITQKDANFRKCFFFSQRGRMCKRLEFSFYREQESFGS